MLGAGATMAGQPGPALVVSPSRLIFIGSEQAVTLPSQRIEIGSRGAWKAVPSARWIRVTPSSGLGAGSAEVSIDPTGLGAGTHTGTIRIDAPAASGSPRVVNVALTIAPRRPAGPSGLNALPDKVAFSAAAGQRDKLTFTVRLRSEQGGAIRWSAVSDRPWLAVSPQKGTTPSELTLTVSPEPLAAGDHTATVAVAGVDAEASVQIPVTLSIRSEGGPLTVGSGTGTLPAATLNIPYSRPIPVRGGRPPYVVQLVAGPLPPELALINGTLVGVPRQPGVFTFTVGVTDSSTPPVSQLQQLRLMVVVLDQNTALAVQPAQLDLQAAGGKAAQASLTVTSGGPPLTWQASADVPWLQVVPLEGVAPAQLKVTVDARTLASGTYTASITLSMDGAPNSPVRVPVRVTIRP